MNASALAIQPITSTKHCPSIRCSRPPRYYLFSVHGHCSELFVLLSLGTCGLSSTKVINGNSLGLHWEKKKKALINNNQQGGRVAAVLSMSVFFSFFFFFSVGDAKFRLRLQPKQTAITLGRASNSNVAGPKPSSPADIVSRSCRTVSLKSAGFDGRRSGLDRP